jgi:biotin carboxylase
MRQALDAAGLPNAAFRVADDWPAVHAAADALGYPVVLKPVDEGGSMFVTCVSDAVELRTAFDRLAAYGVNQRGQTRTPLYLLEEYLQGEEVSVEAYGCDGQTHVLGITDKSVTGFPDFIEDGHMFPAPLEPAVAQATCDLVRGALGVIGYTHGVSHTEVKLTPSGPRIVEINPRSGGNRISELVKLVTGVDLLEVVVELALGRRPNASPIESDICSAAVAFLLPQRAGYVQAVHGVDSFSADPDLVDVTLKRIAGTRVAPSRYNDYLGSVIYADRVGSGARARAQRAIRQITLEFADEEVADDAAG